MNSIVRYSFGFALVAFGSASEGVGQAVQGEPATPRREALERQLRNRTGEMVRRRLDLTDTQMSRLQATNRQFEQQRMTLFTRERETRRALRQELLKEDRANQPRVAELLDQTLQLERQRLDLLQNEQRELAKFLSPVQRAKLLGIQTELRRRTQAMRGRPQRP